MAAAMVSLNTVAAVVPAVSCNTLSQSSSAVNMSSSASFGGVRLHTATTAAPFNSRSPRPLVVSAESKPSLWESITSLFGVGKKKTTEIAAQAEKKLNKASSEAKSTSGDLGKQAQSFKEEAQVKAEQAAEDVKAETEDLKERAEEVVEAAQKN